jgi:hypothetical protein
MERGGSIDHSPYLQDQSSRARPVQRMPRRLARYAHHHQDLYKRYPINPRLFQARAHNRHAGHPAEYRVVGVTLLSAAVEGFPTWPASGELRAADESLSPDWI